MESTSSTFVLENPIMLTQDEGKTVASVTEDEGYYYDVLGNTISVTRYTIAYTDGTVTILDTPNGLRYASTTFIPGVPPAHGVTAYLDAIENHPRKV